MCINDSQLKHVTMHADLEKPGFQALANIKEILLAVAGRIVLALPQQ